MVYFIQPQIISKRDWIAPFGNPRIKAYWRLPEAYRSLLRPSSPIYAKASVECPYFVYLSKYYVQNKTCTHFIEYNKSRNYFVFLNLLQICFSTIACAATLICGIL